MDKLLKNKFTNQFYIFNQYKILRRKSKSEKTIFLWNMFWSNFEVTI